MIPVGNTINPPPNALSQLSGILGIRQQQQQLQTGQYQQQSAQAESEQATAKNQALLAAQNLTKNAINDPSYFNDDGTPKTDKFQRDLTAVGGIYVQPYIGQMTDNFTGAVKNRAVIQGLRADQQAQLGERLGAFAADTNANRKSFKGLLENVRSVVGDDPAARDMIDDALMNAPPKTGKTDAEDSLALRQYARNLAVATQAHSAALSAPSTSDYTTTEGNIGQRQTNVMSPMGTGPVGAEVPQGPAPTIGQNTSQQPAVISGAGVRTLPSVGGGGGGASDRPSPTAPGYEVAGYGRALQDAQAYTTQVRNSDTQNYGVGTHVANVIRQLSKDTATGPGTKTWHTMLAGVSGITGAKIGDAGSDYRLINSYLDRQAAIAQQTMGIPNTNAGMEQAQTLSGTTALPGPALRNKNNLTQALIEGAHQFRQGMDKAAGLGPNPDPQKLNAFKAAWTANFDPNAYRLWTATHSGDKEELDNLQKELGTKGLKELSQKMRNLKALSTTGQLPP